MARPSQEPYDNIAGTEAAIVVGDMPAGSHLRMVINGPDFDDADKTAIRTVLVPIGDEANGAQRLTAADLTVSNIDDKVVVDEPFAGTTFFAELSDYDFYGNEPVTIVQVQSVGSRGYFISPPCYC